MKNGVNKVTLLGVVGKDPVTKTFGDANNQRSISSFSLATGETYMDKNNQKVEKTEWHNIDCWGKLATLASQYIKKGSVLFIEGKIETQSYDKDGGKAYITKIVANEIKFVSSPKNQGTADGSSASQSTNTSQPTSNNNPATTTKPVDEANNYVTSSDFIDNVNGGGFEGDLPF